MLARNEYSVFLTVLPWLRIATGNLIKPASACISLSRRTAISTATRRLSRDASWNAIVSCRIAHLLAVKYATVTSTQSESRTVIPRFIFVLGAPASRGHFLGRLFGLLVQHICHGDVTGSPNIVNCPPVRCAMHPTIVQLLSASRLRFSSSL